jgi:hypothetical protein
LVVQIATSFSLLFDAFLYRSLLRRVFGPKRDEVTGEQRKLHYEELNDLTPYLILCGW